MAEDVSQGACLKYVRRGIQRALGIPEEPTGINSAKDAGPWLKSNGFEEIEVAS